MKGVPLTRMVAFKEESESRISDKHMTWSLSRNGLYAGAVLVVSVMLWQCEIKAAGRCESSKLHPPRSRTFSKLFQMM